jgi:prepilin-type N-terminal cleavage/methylation domain-containing protein
MKKSKKGFTLIEVIVSIAIFATVCTLAFSMLITMRNINMRQKEYVKINMVCYDIDAYYRKYNDEWTIQYFGTNEIIDEAYLDAEFIPTIDKNKGKYIIKLDNNDIFSIYSIENNISFVENVKLPLGED